MLDFFVVGGRGNEMPTLIYVVRVQLRDKLSASNNEVWLRDPQDSTKPMKNICTGHSDTRLI